LEARVRIELTMEVLQTSALPLGYRARSFFAAFAGTPLSKRNAKTKSPPRCRALKTGAGDGD
jgi:hypothetical protein